MSQSKVVAIWLYLSISKQHDGSRHLLALARVDSLAAQARSAEESARPVLPNLLSGRPVLVRRVSVMAAAHAARRVSA